MEKQAELALQLLEKDQRLARAFVRTEKRPEVEATEVRKAGTDTPLLDLRRLSVYERYDLTVMPLFLALLTIIALAATARNQSRLSATIGSTLAARRAGIMQASKEAAATSNAMIAKVRGSSVLTPKSRLSINLVNPKEPASPITTPISVSVIPCLTISVSTLPLRAPSAMRMPISCVRCVTANEMTP
jgi:hypothetical protein